MNNMFLNRFRMTLSGPLRRFLSQTSGYAMEKSLNRVTLLGRVGIDPQLRGNDRTPVALFTVATNSSYMFESGEVQQKTEWHRISVFKPHLRDLIMRTMKKGTRVLIDGRLTYGEIIDANGTPHITTSIIAADIIFLGRPASETTAADLNMQEETEENEKSESY